MRAGLWNRRGVSSLSIVRIGEGSSWIIVRLWTHSGVSLYVVWSMHPVMEAWRPNPRDRGFSMIELVMVVAIIAVIGAIAAPRFSSLSSSTKGDALRATHSVYQKAIELYIAEHGGLSPAQLANGSVDSSGANFITRLTGRTDATGATVAKGGLGPYLRGAPANVMNGMTTVRTNGDAPGKGSHGWRFDPTINAIFPDDSVESVTFIGDLTKKGVDLVITK